jgi:hypothetical protein
MLPRREMGTGALMADSNSPCGRRGCSRRLLQQTLAWMDIWLIGGNLRREQSSPGYLHLGQVLSNGLRQMPQTSSSFVMFQRQEATPFHFLIVTFMLSWFVFERGRECVGGGCLVCGCLAASQRAEKGKTRVGAAERRGGVGGGERQEIRA